MAAFIPEVKIQPMKTRLDLSNHQLYVSRKNRKHNCKLSPQEVSSWSSNANYDDIDHIIALFSSSTRSLTRFRGKRTQITTVLRYLSSFD
mmetsp:Transcript_24415/g.35698  ORF Transcript_24415/g.35698 Transcript_24415/m.35698 type:complete len:90 (-) Transcript_24415:950-1219(-)